MYLYQTSLLYNYQAIIEAPEFHKKYYALFNALDLSDIPDEIKA